MGDIGGGLQAAASVADTSMTNAANIYMQNQANQFNAQQAGLQRNWAAGEQLQSEGFNAQQAALNRQFQAGQQVQAEDYNTMMSNTAVQRRMDDVRAAGLNPLLAASQIGGASTPQVSAPSGSTASVGIPGGSAAQAAGVARLQGGVLQPLANLKLTNAQTAQTQASTNQTKTQTGIAEDELKIWDAETTPEMVMKKAQALAQHYDLDYAEASRVQEAVNVIKQASDQASLDTAYARIRNSLGQMDQDGLRATLDQLIKMRNATYAQETQEAKNVTWAQSGLTGKAIAAAQAVLSPVTSAAGAFGSAAAGWNNLRPSPPKAPFSPTTVIKNIIP